MDKTININLGGSLFQMDEEAYSLLRDYIQAINAKFRNVEGGTETVEDIETRIAEIFRTRKSFEGTVSKESVEYMISVIGKPEDMDTGDQEENYSFSQPDVKRLYRNPGDSVIAGVCGGLGVYLNTDPVLFRILFIIFALFGGLGVFIYLALWIAIPSAYSEASKREMYGNRRYYSRKTGINDGNVAAGSSGINEIMRAVGKVFFIIFRIFLILIGTMFVLTGFVAILSWLMVFVFSYPADFNLHGADFTFTYFPDLMYYIFNQNTAKWIIALLSLVVLLPMIAFIYWGVRMIFWFRVRDGVVNLTGLIVWVLALASLSIILFNEGVSFAESSTTTTRNYFSNTPDTLFIMSGNRMESINYDREFIISDDEYSIFLVDSARNIYINPGIRLSESEDASTSVEIRKRSSGRTRKDASEKSESLVYNYRLSGDTLLLDEYFMLPAGSRWTADRVTATISIPEGSVLYFDRNPARMLDKNRHYIRDYHSGSEDIGNKYWIFSDNILKRAR